TTRTAKTNRLDGETRTCLFGPPTMMQRTHGLAWTLTIAVGCLFSAITATITSYFISVETPSRDAGDRVVERLQRLADLRRDGSPTEMEFVAAKARALAVERRLERRLTPPSEKPLRPTAEGHLSGNCSPSPS